MPNFKFFQGQLLHRSTPGHTGILDVNETMVDQCPYFKTMAQLFKENGYATRAYGKTYHHGESDDPTGYDDYLNPRSGGNLEPRS